ncbi:MAG: PIN domain-containing protein [Nitrospirota bacterium]
MKRIFVDTGAWYAFVDKKDPDHLHAKGFYDDNTLPFITTNFIFDEAVTLIMSRLGWGIAARFGEGLKSSNLVSLVAVTDVDEERAWQIFIKYKNTGFSYTDCTSFALMERLKIETSFTFDEHFQTMNFRVAPVL